MISFDQILLHDEACDKANCDSRNYPTRLERRRTTNMPCLDSTCEQACPLTTTIDVFNKQSFEAQQ
jgi:hypothetical protein